VRGNLLHKLGDEVLGLYTFRVIVSKTRTSTKKLLKQDIRRFEIHVEKGDFHNETFFSSFAPMFIHAQFFKYIRLLNEPH
jgi:hypothetical protein